ncbi:MAG: hypothetical protein R3D68_07160 [Hyphomicrobiaceae bacterium]
MTLPMTREFLDNYLTGNGQAITVPARSLFEKYSTYIMEPLSQHPSFMSQLESAVDGQSLNQTLIVDFYLRDPFGQDWYDRALNYGMASFKVNGTFRLVDGEMRFVGTITSEKDNWDFASNGSRGRELDLLAGGPRALLDPGNVGKTFDIIYWGGGLAVDVNLQDMNHAADSYGDQLRTKEMSYPQLVEFFQQNMDRLFQEFPEAVPVFGGQLIFAGI